MLTCRVESSSLLHVTLGGLEPADANGAAIATIAGLPAEAAPVVIEAYGATSLHRQLELPKSSSWTELTQARDAYRDVHELYTRLTADADVIAANPGLADCRPRKSPKKHS